MPNQIDPTIKEIIESDIFDYLELAAMPEEDKAKMMENLMTSLRARIMLRMADIIEEKSKEDFEEFKKLLNNNPAQERVEEFIGKYNIKLDQLTAEEAILLKAEVMGLKKSNLKSAAAGATAA